MCGLFGFVAYGRGKQVPERLKDLARYLGEESTERGTDATGISYLHRGTVRINKAPKSAWEFKFTLPKGVKALMGHTRRTTQGNERMNYNNHPFKGTCRSSHFAFAHNGVLDNEWECRDEYNLPETHIETDSYVGCQLLEKFGDLSPVSLKRLGEAVEGMFAFTILDSKGDLHIVRNDSPFIIAHFKKLKLYVYASTEEILFGALARYDKTAHQIVQAFRDGDTSSVELIEPEEGSILTIRKNGSLEWSKFTPLERWGKMFDWRFQLASSNGKVDKKLTVQYEEELVPFEPDGEDEEQYYEMLVAIAGEQSISRMDIEVMLQYYSLTQIEQSLYDGSIDELLLEAQIMAGFKTRKEVEKEVCGCEV